MKAERVFVLRFNDGSRIPYGVPDFMSEEEAADFQAHVLSELVEGAANYFQRCCKPAKAGEGKASGDRGATGQPSDRPTFERSLTFSNHPSDKTLRLEERVNQLRWLSQASLEMRAKQRAAEAELERQRLEARQAIQSRSNRGPSHDR